MNDDVEYIGVFQIKLKKKFYSLDKIDDFAHNGKPKESKTLIVLTHLARRFFVPKTFFTENYKDKVVVYGTLKPQYKNLQGGSIFSAAKEFVQKGIAKVKDIFSPRLDNYNNLSTRVLKQYGDVPVVDILIYRAPIASMLNTVINFISGGKWNDLLKKYGFDKLFHLSLVFRLANGKMIIVEKNEVVNISDSYKTKANTEVFQVTGYSGGKTLYEFVNGARQKVGNDKIFFGYNPFTNNCQFFIRYILETAGLYSEGAKNFLFQDLSKVAEGLSPTTKAIMKGVTDLGAVASKLSGKGKRGKKVGGADAAGGEEETFSSTPLFRPVDMARISSITKQLRHIATVSRNSDIAYTAARNVDFLSDFTVFNKPIPATQEFAEFLTRVEKFINDNPQTETTPREAEASMFVAGELETDKAKVVEILKGLRNRAEVLKQMYPKFTDTANTTITTANGLIERVKASKTKADYVLIYKIISRFVERNIDIIEESFVRGESELVQEQYRKYDEDEAARKKKGSGKGKKVGGADEWSQEERKREAIRLRLRLSGAEIMESLDMISDALDGIPFAKTELDGIAREAGEFTRTLSAMTDGSTIREATDSYIQTLIRRGIELVVKSYNREMEVYRDMAIKAITKEYSKKDSEFMNIIISSINKDYDNSVKEISDDRFSDETNPYKNVKRIKTEFKTKMINTIKKVKTLADDLEDAPLPTPKGSGKAKKGRKGKKVGGADSGSDDELSDIFSKLKVEPEAMAVDEAPRSVAPTPLAPRTRVVRPPVIVATAPNAAPAASTSPVDRKRAKTPEKGDSKKEKKGGAGAVSDSSAARQRIINEFRILKADIDFLDREFPSPIAMSVFMSPLIRKMDSLTNESVLTRAKLQEFDELYNTVRPQVIEAVRRNLERLRGGSKKK